MRFDLFCPDLRSTFDLDFSGLKHTFSDASRREKLDSAIILAPAWLVPKLFTTHSFPPMWQFFTNLIPVASLLTWPDNDLCKNRSPHQTVSSVVCGVLITRFVSWSWLSKYEKSTKLQKTKTFKPSLRPQNFRTLCFWGHIRDQRIAKHQNDPEAIAVIKKRWSRPTLLCNMHRCSGSKHAPNLVTIGPVIPELYLCGQFWHTSRGTRYLPGWSPNEPNPTVIKVAWIDLSPCEGRVDIGSTVS